MSEFHSQAILVNAGRFTLNLVFNNRSVIPFTVHTAALLLMIKYKVELDNIDNKDYISSNIFL